MAPRSSSSTLVAAIRTHSEALIDLIGATDDSRARIRPQAGRSLPDLIGHLVAVVVRHTPEQDRPEPDTPSRWLAAGTGFEHALDSGLPPRPPRPSRPVRLPAPNGYGTAVPRVVDLPTALTALRSAVAELPAGPALDTAGPVPYTDRVEAVPADLYGVILGELLVHGHDIAALRHGRWRIAPEDAAEAIRAMATVLPARLDPARTHDLRCVIELRVRGDRRYLCRFTDGTLVVDPPVPPARVDVRISGRPTAVLMLLRGRLPLRRGLLTGRLMVWGRHPGLARSAAGMFHEP